MKAKSAARCLPALCLVLFASACRGAGPAGSESPYPREHIYETSVGPDEAAVNVSVACSRWPDCTTLESAVRDIFRLEGVQAKSDQDKALALWKWFRILVSSTGGSYAYEGPKGREKLCRDPHKIFTVYGHHQCDGLAWAMVPLWRAAGYMAFDECHWGHTMAALRYKDADGQVRFHSFDPQARIYYWDPKSKRVGTRSVPVMRGMVYRHVTTPQHLHSLRTSLRVGEAIERKWTNEGHVIPSGRDKLAAEKTRYYAYRPGKTDGVYAAVGEEVQTLVADSSGEHFATSLHDGSRNTACHAPKGMSGLLHPAKRDQAAAFVYRMAPPYVVADARVEATLVKGDPADLCRLSLSWDGRNWQPFYAKEKIGEEKIAINIGREAWKLGRPNVYTAYNFFVRAELKTANDVRTVGIKALKVVARRMLNKRTLPHLRPGENVIRVTADRIAKDLGLELAIHCRANGRPRTERRFILSFPYYFKIVVPGAAETVHKNYDQRWNDGALQMSSIKMWLRPIQRYEEVKPVLAEADGRAKFAMPSPHPADMTRRRIVKHPETDIRQTGGFLPQADKASLRDDERMNALIKELHGGSRGRRWQAAEELGNYPKALDALLAALPKADIDLTVFLCKALARMPDKRAIGPLLAKWKRAPRGAPGTRYIPDVLAAIGDRSVVPDLIAPLKRCRFDFRFHIAHALGALGGPQAERALADLAKNDPFPAVREEAAAALARLRRGKP